MYTLSPRKMYARTIVSRPFEWAIWTGHLDGPFGLVKECTKGRNGPLFHRPIEWAIWIRQITNDIRHQHNNLQSNLCMCHRQFRLPQFHRLLPRAC